MSSSATSTSRRTRLAPRTTRSDGRSTGAAPDLLDRIAAAAVFAIAGVAALLAALRLAAVAAHWSFSPVRWLHVPTTPGGRAAVGVLLLVLMLALLAVLLRRDEQRLTIGVSERGALLLGTAALERVVAGSVGAHLEVVRVRVEIRSRSDGLAAEVRVAARPQVDAATLLAEIEETVVAALRRATGLPVAAVRVKLTVLRAKDLRRYL